MTRTRFTLTLHTRRGEHRHSFTLHEGLRPGKAESTLRREAEALHEHETRGRFDGLLLTFPTGATLRLAEHDCTFALRLTRRTR